MRKKIELYQTCAGQRNLFQQSEFQKLPRRISTKPALPTCTLSALPHYHNTKLWMMSSLQWQCNNLGSGDMENQPTHGSRPMTAHTDRKSFTARNVAVIRLAPICAMDRNAPPSANLWCQPHAAKPQSSHVISA